MKIVFDMDGVLADFYAGFWDLANVMFGTPTVPDPNDWTWDNYGVGITKDQADKVWKRINQDNRFWVSLPQLASPEELRRIKNLAEDHEVYFVTARTGKLPKEQTETWLHVLGYVRFPTVILSNRKGEVCASVKADYCIDDKAGNAVYVGYHSPKTKSYLLDAPYNQFEHDVLGSKVRRVKSVTEYLDDIEAGR